MSPLHLTASMRVIKAHEGGRVSQVIRDFMDAVYRDLVPGGTLRAALSYGNSGLVQRDISSGELRDVAVDLFDELAQRLSVRRSLVGYEGSVSVFEAGSAGAWDVAILAIDRVRAERLDFTLPLAVLEGTYVIREPSPCSTVLDLDRAGMHILTIASAPGPTPSVAYRVIEAPVWRLWVDQSRLARCLNCLKQSCDSSGTEADLDVAAIGQQRTFASVRCQSSPCNCFRSTSRAATGLRSSVISE